MLLVTMHEDPDDGDGILGLRTSYIDRIIFSIYPPEPSLSLVEVVEVVEDSRGWRGK